MVAPYWSARATFERPLRALIDVTTGVLVLIGLYFVLGVAANPGSAATYLRNIAAPFLLFQIFVLIAYRYPVTLTTSLIVIAVMPPTAISKSSPRSTCSASSTATSTSTGACARTTKPACGCGRCRKPAA